jgi:hydrogenase maturation protease
MLMERPGHSITILGLGNVLLTDEGLGIHMVQRLRKKYIFSPGVEVVDGGTLGLNLLPLITNTDRLLVMDAVKNGGEPGDTYVFTLHEVPCHLRVKNSLHESGLMEVLALSEYLAQPPETVIVGLEPLDTTSWGVSLTLPVKQNLDRMERLVLEQLSKWGEKPEVRPEADQHETPELFSGECSHNF